MKKIPSRILSALVAIAAIAVLLSASSADAALYRPLRQGDSGPDVRELQRELNARGFSVAKDGPGSPGMETDSFGPATFRALRAFQCAGGIACSGSAEDGYGRVGPRTLRALGQGRARVLDASTDSPIAQYSFEGNASDSSGLGNNGTVGGGASFGPGKSGQGIVFDGADDYVDIPEIIEGKASITAAAWAKRSDMSSSTRVIFNESGAGRDSIVVSFAAGTGSNDYKYKCVIDNGVSLASSESSAQYNDANWHHVACTYDGAEVRLYIDGALADTTPGLLTGSIAASANNLTIGSPNATTWAGSIDDARIYATALSSADIAALYGLAGAASPASASAATQPPSTGTTAPVSTTPPVTTTTVAPIVVAPQPVVSVRTPAPAAIQWTSPIGIPDPASSFGGFDPIRGTHFMYQLPAGVTSCAAGEIRCFDFGAGKVPYPDAGSGPYTHYVDSSNPNSTDTNNAYGTPVKPRKTIPSDVPAGSVVEVHGGPYSPGSSWFNMKGNGTAQAPVFFRGVGGAKIFDRIPRIMGSYVVVENFEAYGDKAGLPVYGAGNHHIVIRGNYTHDKMPTTGGSSIAAGSGKDIVIFNNRVFNNGSPDNCIGTAGYDPSQPSGVRCGLENDVHGVHVGLGSERVWILDNEIKNNGGDSVQVNGGINEPFPIYVYIGRNKMHEEGENAVDIKTAKHVVISQNDMYGFGPTHFVSSGSDGTAVVINDDNMVNRLNNDIWVIFNKIHHSRNAIRTQAYAYMIGNVIHDIDNAALISFGGHDAHFENNTVYGVTGAASYGVDRSGGSAEFKVTALNNIFQQMSDIQISVKNSMLNSKIADSVFGGGTKYVWGGSAFPSLAAFKSSQPAQCSGCSQGSIAFVDASAKDFRLTDAPGNSAAINQAHPSAIYDLFQSIYGVDIKKDFAGNPRPQGSAWDIGAYEYAGTFNPAPGTAAPATNIPAPVTPSPLASAGAIVVSPTGSDSNAGTDAAPFKTIQKAISVATAGKIVLIKSGTYQNDLANCVGATCTFVSVDNSGTASSPITIKAYGDGPVVLRGLGFQDADANGDGLADGPLYPSKRETLMMVKGNYVRVSDLEFTNSGQLGLAINGSFGTYENIKSHDNWSTNIDIGGGVPGRVEGNVVRYAETFRSRSSNGISYRRPDPTTDLLTNNVVEYSLAYNNGRRADGGRMTPSLGDPAGGGNSDGMGTSKLCSDYPAFNPFPYANACPKNAFRFNVVAGNSDDGFDMSYADSLMEGNISFGNGGAAGGGKGYKMLRDVSGMRYVGNIAYENADRGFDLRSSNLDFINNTAVSNGAQGALGIDSDSRAKNNLSYNNGMSDFSMPTVCAGCSNNWVGDRTGVSLSGNPQLANIGIMQRVQSQPSAPGIYKDATGQLAFVYPSGVNTVRAKVEWIQAQFVAALGLRAGSGALDAGIAASYADPVTGSSRLISYAGSAPDLGAIESGLGLRSSVAGSAVSIPSAVTQNLDADNDGVPLPKDVCPNTPASLKASVNQYGCPMPKVSGFDVAPDVNQDIRTILNLRFAKNGVGEIRFGEQVNLVRELDAADVTANLVFAPKKISLDSAKLPELNKKATVVFYGITESRPMILKNGTECVAPACVIRSFENGTLSLDVQGFSTYEVTEGVSAPVIVPAPASAPTGSAGSGSSVGASGSSQTTASEPSPVIYGAGLPTPQLQGASAVPAGCQPGAAFSTLTGQRCPAASASSAAPAYAFARSLSLGMRGEDVRALQRFLNASGFAVARSGPGSAGNETLSFGPATRAALARYQAARGIRPAAGFFGPATRATVSGGAPNTPPSSASAPSVSAGTTLRLGSSGPAVKVLRQKLRAAGYLAPYGSASDVPASAAAETSAFGATTESALRKFQCERGIACSGSGWGIAGPATRAALGL